MLQAKEFDIGVYFEANGHGTVIFSERALAAARERSQDNTATREQREGMMRA